MALTDSLISFWELEETSGARVDAHGSNDLTDNNTVGSGTGKVGTAASFASVASEYLSRASNADLVTGDIDFTFCAWVKPTNTASKQIVAKDDETNGREYTLDIDSVGPTFRWYINGGSGSDLVSIGGPSAGTWSFIVVWHDATANTINIQHNNGTPLNSTPGSTVPTGTAQFRIGAREYSGFEGYFDGLIDQVGFWKRVLTSDERTELYNGGAGVSYADIAGGAAVVGVRGFPRGMFHGLRRRVDMGRIGA